MKRVTHLALFGAISASLVQQTYAQQLLENTGKRELAGVICAANQMVSPDGSYCLECPRDQMATPDGKNCMYMEPTTVMCPAGMIPSPDGISCLTAGPPPGVCPPGFFNMGFDATAPNCRECPRPDGRGTDPAVYCGDWADCHMSCFGPGAHATTGGWDATTGGGPAGGWDATTAPVITGGMIGTACDNISGHSCQPGLACGVMPASESGGMTIPEVKVCVDQNACVAPIECQPDMGMGPDPTMGPATPMGPATTGPAMGPHSTGPRMGPMMPGPDPGPRAVYPFVDSENSAPENIKWQFFFGDGQRASRAEYDRYSDYQQRLAHGGEPDDGDDDLWYEDVDLPGDSADSYGNSIIREKKADTGPRAAQAVYMGCYADCADEADGTIGKRSVEEGFIRRLGAFGSPESCAQIAKDEGFEYAALKKGKRCYGGNNLFEEWSAEKRGMADPSPCNEPCKNDSRQMCGGSQGCWKSVWRTSGGGGKPCPPWTTSVAGGACEDIPEAFCPPDQVQAEDGGCYPYDQWGDDELMNQGWQARDAVERLRGTREEINMLERDLAEAALDTDFHFDPGCGMDSSMQGQGRCQKCDRGVQSNFGDQCVMVGAQQFPQEGYWYLGSLINGRKEGRGEIRWYKDNERYLGEFRDDQIEGYGKKFFANGNVYEGDFREGRPEGWGTYRYKSGREYNGDFRGGQFNGKGSLMWPDGTMIDGNFRDDEANGYGNKYYPSGERYEGNFENGYESGYGKYFGPDGTIEYDGKFDQGKRMD